MQIQIINLIHCHVVDAIILEVQDTVGKPSNNRTFTGGLVESFEGMFPETLQVRLQKST